VVLVLLLALGLPADLRAMADTNAWTPAVPQDAAAPVRLEICANLTNSPPPALGALVLRAYGETLLGPLDASEAAIQTGALGALLHANVLVNGRGPESSLTQPFRVVEQSAGSEWEHVCLDLTPAYSDRLSRFHRHLLFIRPDLCVVFDDLAASEPARFELILHAPGPLSIEPRSGDLTLELPKAGFVGHVLTLARKDFTPWARIQTGAATNAAAAALRPSHLRTGSTNRLAELRVLTALRVHPRGQKRGSGFVLLEGDNCIGARIYRDGLPTLAAFRTAPGAAEANFRGMRFTGPVAVDVFTGQRKQR
jgi:hypothetical protein